MKGRGRLAERWWWSDKGRGNGEKRKRKRERKEWEKNEMKIYFGPLYNVSCNRVKSS